MEKGWESACIHFKQKREREGKIGSTDLKAPVVGLLTNKKKKENKKENKNKNKKIPLRFCFEKTVDFKLCEIMIVSVGLFKVPSQWFFF